MDPDTSHSIIFTQATNTVNYNTVWGMPSYVCWILIAVLLLISGMYSACENAYSNCNKYHFKAMASKGNVTAKVITHLVDFFDNTLVTVLIGNNIVQTLMSTLSAILFYNLCQIYNLGDGVEAILSTVVMAFLVYVISDTCPKILSKEIPNRMAYILAYPVLITNILLYPVIFIFKVVLILVHKIFKIKDESLLTKDDLLHSVNLAVNPEEENLTDGVQKQEKLFEKDEKTIVNNVFTYDRLKVKDVYTPFEKVFSINIDDLAINKLNSIIVKTDFSRFPIYEDEKNNIIGILVLKTYFQEFSKDNHLDVRSILEQPIFIDLEDPIDEVFDELNANKVHLGIVADKNNKMIGIITMEDILEELVDDIDEKPAHKLKWRLK